MSAAPSPASPADPAGALVVRLAHTIGGRYRITLPDAVALVHVAPDGAPEVAYHPRAEVVATVAALPRGGSAARVLHERRLAMRGVIEVAVVADGSAEVRTITVAAALEARAAWVGRAGRLAYAGLRGAVSGPPAGHEARPLFRLEGCGSCEIWAAQLAEHHLVGVSGFYDAAGAKAIGGLCQPQEPGVPLCRWDVEDLATVVDLLRAEGIEPSAEELQAIAVDPAPYVAEQLRSRPPKARDNRDRCDWPAVRAEVLATGALPEALDLAGLMPDPGVSAPELVTFVQRFIAEVVPNRAAN